MVCNDCGGDPVRAALVRLVAEVVARVAPGLRDVRALPHLNDVVERAERELRRREMPTEPAQEPPTFFGHKEPEGDGPDEGDGDEGAFPRPQWRIAGRPEAKAGQEPHGWQDTPEIATGERVID